jgi:molecular chaperone GrpE
MPADLPPIDPARLLDAFDGAGAAEAQLRRHRSEIEALLRSFLEVTDALRALERHCGEADAEGEARVPVSTVRRIAKKALQVLALQDVRPMDAVGGPLDLSRHEVLQVRDDATRPPDTVLEEVIEGYLWGERILRRATVVVSGEAPGPGDPTTGGQGGVA